MQDDKDLSSLKALAEKAVPGPWFTHWKGVYSGTPKTKTDGELSGYDHTICEMDDLDLSDRKVKANAKFIAAANPQAILSLISRIEELEARIAECVGVLGAKDGELYSLRNQLAVAETKRSPAVDLSGLTRYDLILGSMVEKSLGDYVKLTDVQALIASPARDVGGLTDARCSEICLRAHEAVAEFIANSKSLHGDNGINGVFIRTILEAVAPLATKEADPVQAAQITLGAG